MGLFRKLKSQSFRGWRFVKPEPEIGALTWGPRRTFSFHWIVSSLYFYNSGGVWHSDQARSKAMVPTTAPAAGWLPHWLLLWLQGWQEIPPTEEARGLPGCHGRVASATFPQANYVASMYTFLLVKHNLNPTSRLKLHGKLLKCTLHWINGSRRMKTASWGR